MGTFNVFWVDIICLAVAAAFLNGAITGNFYSHGRGGRRTLFASVKSSPARVVFLLVAIGVFAWVIRDFLQKIHR